MKKIVVYTAITQGYDTLKPPPEIWRKEASFVAFLETPQPDQGWEIRPIYRRFSVPCRNAKVHKILSHRFFPEAEYSLWIDGSILIKSELPLREWIDEYLDNTDLATFQHGMRDCLYHEGAACIQLGLDSGAVINKQMKKYFRKNYPPNRGLAECAVLFRRHSPSTRRFNEAWYAEIQAHSFRDQLSFNYVANVLKYRYSHLPGSLLDNPHFIRTRHAKRAASPSGRVSFDKPDIIIVGHQRSGTHFLESCLASHPRVHKRSECLLQYRRVGMDKYLSQHYLDAHCFANVKSKINVAIVMYSQIRLLEELCGPLSQFKIIHLLRAADAVARSLVQLAANKAYYGRKVKAHYCLGERQLPNAPYDKLEVERIRHEVVLSQNKHTEYLASCKNVLVLHYEDLTQNQQVNRLPEHIASKILAFLCLDYCPLDNPLQKSGPGAL